MFNKNNKDVKDIVKYLENNNIKIKDVHFSKTIEEIDLILKLCKKHNMEVKTTIFKRKASNFEAIINNFINQKNFLLRFFQEVLRK